ncbi:glycosyltransferase [bacterium]|nr:glycosyltransferase [bacterium]
MSLPQLLRKSPFDVLTAVRRRVFESANAPLNCFLGTASQCPCGLSEQALAATTAGDSILLLGNGHSDLLADLAQTGRKVTVADWAESALAATELPRRKLRKDLGDSVRAQLLKNAPFPFQPGAFKAIVITGVLNQIEHNTPLLKECSRLLADGGALILGLPDDLSFYHPTFQVLFTREKLQSKLSLFFESVKVEESPDGVLFARASNHRNTRHPVIFAQMNIKNEDRWIREALDNTARLCDGIIVYDDGSTDRTPEICLTHPAVVAYERREEETLDKARDKNRMLDMTREFKSDWILCIDGDELLEETAPQRILDEIRNAAPEVTKIDFEFLYLWNDRKHVRTDGIYTGIYHPCLFRSGKQSLSELRFEATNHGGNLHLERTPTNLKGESHRADVKIEHLGYMYPEDRMRKYLWNKSKDPRHADQGYYEHLLDQPNMTLAEWRGRGYPKSRSAQATDKQTLKPDYYYANARRNLAELVPTTARRVLDVGCGNGATGALIQQLTGAKVTGLEIHPEVASVAREVLTEVFVLDIETATLPFEKHCFDAILLGDVLEHLIDPWKALTKLSQYIKPDGQFIVSLPNIRNLGIIGKLLEGSWDYQEWGILDSTHLRFFARKNMLELFQSAGIEAELVEIVRDPLFEEKMKNPPAVPVTLDMGGVILKDVTPDDLNELTAQQLIFVGKLKQGAQIKQTPKASVVIPVFNNLAYTQKCIESLFVARESTPHEIIVVDDGSTDGTAEYLRSLGDQIRVVTHDRNYGFARSCNDGARASHGKLVTFLNNDTEVLPGWLDEMARMMEQDYSIGIVGNLQIFPGSELVQQCGIVCDENGMVHSLYNHRLPASHPVVQVPREFQFIAGSCFLIPRQLFMEVGGFDERFVNSCEDIDLCMRVRETGRRVFYQPKSRIYHHESKSVTGHDKNGANYALLLSRWKDKMQNDAERTYRADGFRRDEHGNLFELSETKSENRAEILMKTALLTTYHQKCGLATYAEQLVHAMRKQGADPLILAEVSGERTASDEPDVLRCWSREKNGGSELVALLKLHEIELLHINYGGIFPLGGWLLDVMKTARAEGIRIVTTFHTTESLAGEIGDIARYSDLCLVHHPQNVIELTALGAPPDRTKVIPLGMNPIEPVDLTEQKLSLGWNPEQKVIATFGMMDPHKGIFELIEALPALLQKTSLTLRVFGAPHPHSQSGADYLRACHRRAAELNVTDHVEFISEYLPDETLKAALQACDVIALNYQSKRFEGSACLSLALSSGRPVVSSLAPALDLPEPATFRVTEEFSLAEALYRTLTNPFISIALRNAALEHEKSANWKDIAQAHLDSYSSVIASAPACTTDLLKLYATHPDEIYTEALHRERVRWLKSKASGRILEIGPANGYVVQFCNGHEAVDIWRGRLDVARALRPGITFEYGNVVEGLPHSDKSFDTVMSPEIFEHVEWPEAIRALSECMRVGKRVLITIPNADKLNYNPDLVHNPEHRWLVTRQLLEGFLREAGAKSFELDCSEDLDFYLIDIDATATSEKIVITERAAALPFFDVTPGPNLHIGFDASLFSNNEKLQSNTGRHFIELLNAVRDARPGWTLTLFTDQPNDLRATLRNAGAETGYEVCAWSEFESCAPNLLYLPDPTSESASYYAERSSGANIPVACTFHDLIPLIYAQFYLAPNPLERDRYVNALKALTTHCALFFSTTQQTLQEMQVRLGLPLARLRCVYPGATERFTSSLTGGFDSTELKRSLPQGTPYFLVGGELSPVRNLRAILLALTAARSASGQDIKLVLDAQLPASAIVQILKPAQELGLPADALVFTSEITEADRARLYQNAVAYLNPSFYEGCRLATIDSLSASLPQIANEQESQRELLGDAALFVNPADAEAIAAAMLKLVTELDLRKTLSSQARARHDRLSWQLAAEKTCVYLTELVVKTQKRNSVKKALFTQV